MPGGLRREAMRQATSPSTKTDRTKPYKDDIEANHSYGGSLRQRFQHAIGSVIEDQRRKKMKKTLCEDIDHQHLESFRKVDSELKKISNKKLRKFYEDQNEKLDDWLEVDTLVKHLADDILDSFDPHDEDGDGIPEYGQLRGINERIEPFLPQEEREKRQKNRKYAKWAINVNVIANIVLLGAKIVAVFASSSLSLIASLADSALDLLCTIIIWTTNRLVAWRITGLSRRFPIMIVSFLQILQESVKKLLPSASHEAAALPAVAIFSMVFTVGLKGLIGIGCYRFKTTQVQALVQDCKTDVVFNTASLLFPLIGHRFGLWWLDPVGAGLLSLFIIYDWAETCLENVARLTGVAVEDRILKKIMFLAWRFAPVVDAYKSITAYHAGDGVWVEVDLLMNERTTLEHCHDVAETLQYCLEGLDEVDRAFVTVDYTRLGPSGHVQEAA